MMSDLHISRLSAHYRMQADDPEARSRLDKTLRRVASSSLEEAVRSANILSSEEVCIRSVSAPVRLRLDSQDATLEQEWSSVIAASIRSTIDRAGSEVIRYRNRGHALLDMALGVAASDYSRVWAWRQLQLWSAVAAASDVEGGNQLRGALLRNPEAIVATLSAAGRAGGLSALIRVLPPQTWVELAEAALAVAGGGLEGSAIGSPLSPPAPTADATSATGRGRAAAPGPRPDLLVRLTAQVVRDSWIGRSLSAGDVSNPLVLPALALLSIIETDVTQLRRVEGPGRDLLSSVAAALSAKFTAPFARSGGEDTVQRRKDRGFVGGGEAFSRLHSHASSPEARRASARSRDLQSETTGREDGPRTGGPPPTSPARSTLLPDRRSGVTRPVAGGDDAAHPGIETDERPLPGVDAPVATEWGGIFFLHHIVAELRIPADVARQAAFQGRPMRWVMQRVILNLLPLDAGDPAFLALLGLPPLEGDPFASQEPPSQPEQTAIEEISSRLALRFLERLTGAGAEMRGAVAETISSYVRRSADLATTPGWIEVRLRLDEVDVAVRRAGLDLDPGWIPWLGLVVKLVYE